MGPQESNSEYVARAVQSGMRASSTSWKTPGRPSVRLNGLFWSRSAIVSDSPRKDFYQPAILEISGQDGESFSGTVSTTNRHGNLGSATISGGVTGTREISGQFTAPTDSGTFNAVLAGDTTTVLTVTFSGEFRSGNHSCQTAGSFLLVRSGRSQ